MEVLSFEMVPSSTVDPALLKGVPTFDYTKLTAINTCPTWGLVRYDSHKTFGNGNQRAMALEAGSAAHEAYAAIRLADLYLNGHHFYPDLDVHRIAAYRMVELFGGDEAVALQQILIGNEDDERKIMLVALERFSQSGYYEDPSDRKRTIANIEESLIAYVQRYPIGETMPIIIDNFVGVEISVDMYCTFRYALGVDAKGNPLGINEDKIRFTGKIDGLHYKNKSKKTIVVEENKTASRIDQAWETSFELTHQVTGYCLAASTILNLEVREAIIRGMAIPLPKHYDYGGIVNIPVKRKLFQINDWIQWLVSTYRTWLEYRDDPVNAPKYTHSCNRYFRVCPMHPICLSEPEDRIELFDEMRIEEWSPLESGSD